jgi:hypothetical protein
MSSGQYIVLHGDGSDGLISSEGNHLIYYGMQWPSYNYQMSSFNITSTVAFWEIMLNIMLQYVAPVGWSFLKPSVQGNQLSSLTLAYCMAFFLIILF